MEQLKIKKVHENATLPTRGSTQAAGLDLCACLDAPVTIEPGSRAKIPTGLAVALPCGTVGLICARSGLGTKHGVTLSNSVGVIDSDYRGEMLVSLINTGKEPYTVEPGERIAQMLVLPVLYPELAETDELDDTERGAGGFGSTGRT